MSSTFDTAQQALTFLSDQIPEETEQTQDVLMFLRDILDGLHDYSHAHNDELNRGRPAIAAQNLRIALKHEDNEERAMWLRVKQKTKGGGKQMPWRTLRDDTGSIEPPRIPAAVQKAREKWHRLRENWQGELSEEEQSLLSHASFFAHLAKSWSDEEKENLSADLRYLLLVDQLAGLLDMASNMPLFL